MSGMGSKVVAIHTKQKRVWKMEEEGDVIVSIKLEIKK